MLVILTLSEERLRYSLLRGRLPAIMQKVLTQTLRVLERDGLVRRRVYDSVPPKTEYDLTSLGHSLAGAVAVIRAWAYDNMEEIAEARVSYDATRTIAPSGEGIKGIGRAGDFAFDRQAIHLTSDELRAGPVVGN